MISMLKKHGNISGPTRTNVQFFRNVGARTIFNRAVWTLVYPKARPLLNELRRTNICRPKFSSKVADQKPQDKKFLTSKFLLSPHVDNAEHQIGDDIGPSNSNLQEQSQHEELHGEAGFEPIKNDMRVPYDSMIRSDKNKSSTITKFIEYLVRPNAQRDVQVPWHIGTTSLPIRADVMNEAFMKQLLKKNRLDADWKGRHYSGVSVVQFAIWQWSIGMGHLKYKAIPRLKENLMRFVDYVACLTTEEYIEHLAKLQDADQRSISKLDREAYMRRFGSHKGPITFSDPVSRIAKLKETLKNKHEYEWLCWTKEGRIRPFEINCKRARVFKLRHLELTLGSSLPPNFKTTGTQGEYHLKFSIGGKKKSILYHHPELAQQHPDLSRFVISIVSRGVERPWQYLPLNKQTSGPRINFERHLSILQQVVKNKPTKSQLKQFKERILTPTRSKNLNLDVINASQSKIVPWPPNFAATTMTYVISVFPEYRSQGKAFRLNMKAGATNKKLLKEFPWVAKAQDLWLLKWQQFKIQHSALRAAYKRRAKEREKETSRRNS